MNNKSEPTLRLQIKTQHIELYKILKIEGLVSSGAIAKNEISSGRVKVNGLTEIRKRKKILAGDIVEYLGEKISVY
jgi:ribosome-associated protein